MKKHIRFLALMLALVTILGVVPRPVVHAATNITTTEVTAKLNNWKGKLNGKYWNYYNRQNWDSRRSEVEKNLKAIADNGVLDQANPSNAALGVTTSGCSGKNYASGCRSNYFSGGWQCQGFARWIQYALFGTTYKFSSSDFNVYSGNALNSIKLQPGDLVYLPEHAAIIADVSSNGRLTCVEAWGGSGCKINWSSAFNYDDYATESSLLAAFKSKGGQVIRYKYISSQPVASTLGISVTSAPKEIKVGSSWGMRGSVTSNYSITRIDGSVCKYDNNGKLGAPVMSSVDYPNATSVDIRYSQVNNALTFNKLSAGKYRLLISATDSSGKTEHWGEDFNVYGEVSTLKINWTQYPETIKKGKCFGLRGSITSNYTITEVRGYIYPLDETVKKKYYPSGIADSTLDTPNSGSFDIRYGNINNYLEFNKLQKGYYALKIEARDSSGKIVAIVRNFTIT